MWEEMIMLDTNLLLFLNSLHNRFLDVLMYLLTHLWAWIPVFGLLFWRIWKHYQKKTWIIAAFLGLSLVFTDRSSSIIKGGFKRPRPSHNELISDRLHLHQYKDGTFYKGGAYGFVSSHAANSFGLVTLLIYFFLPISRRLCWVFPFAALLFCYTRIYLGVHYPTDILGGAALGVLCGLFALWLYKTAIIQIEKS